MKTPNKSPAEVFDEACKTGWVHKGVPLFRRFPLDPAHYQTEFFRGMTKLLEGTEEFVRNTLSVHNLEKVHVDFIDDGRINAFAAVIDGRGYIGFNRGALLLPFDTVYRMLSHPQVLPQIGDPSKEVLGPQHEEKMLQDYDVLPRDRQISGPSIPKDPNRQFFAKFVLETISAFLMYHEMAHIVNGHCGYFKATTGIPLIMESLPMGLPPVADPLIRQTLEGDADYTAVRLTLPSLLGSFDRREQWSPQQRALVTDRLQLLFAWVFSMAVLFHIWRFDVDMATLNSTFHPPSGIRLKGLLSSAIYGVSRAYDLSEKTVIRIIEEALGEAYRAGERIGGRVMSDADVDASEKMANSAETSKYMRQLATKWTELRPELLKFSYTTYLNHTVEIPDSSFE